MASPMDSWKKQNNTGRRALLKPWQPLDLQKLAGGTLHGVEIRGIKLVNLGRSSCCERVQQHEGTSAKSYLTPVV